nr:retrovirus-related Pol polyprotein from transposon TNT 1-94 [Tanacetum cinerariifolium]
MANLSKDIQCAGFDTRPPMLDRTDFASWQQRNRLYCQDKENGVNILKSIDEGPFQMGTVREPLAEGTEGAPHLGPERPRVYSDLSLEVKDRYNADIRATNLLLQGLPKDIYILINHYTDAKDIWDNAKMLLEGSELTKEDQESQLYNNFKHFRQHKGETIHDYYVRFAKLINDMRNIKMTMSRMQLNSKFVNNMYLNGHYSQASSTLPFTYVPPYLTDNAHLDSSLSPTDKLIKNLTNTLALLTQSYKTFLPQTNNQPRTSSNTRNQATVQDGQVMVQNFLAGPSYDSDILSEVQDHDHYQDAICAHHEEHAMHDNVQLNHVLDSHADYMSDSNMIPYDQYVKDNMVAIGYKNPLCLTRAKQVLSALYNGHEIIKDNHVPTIVHNTEDTLEIAEITKRKMNDKMKDPECVTHKVKIAPHDYSKENFLATFIPQKQLTPEQIFWSQDLIKLKSEALKEQTTISKPIKALMVYPPNTHATLVLRVLLTKSQVKIHIFTLI